MLYEPTGELKVYLRFHKGSRRKPVVTGECSGVLALTCQVCLEPVLIDLTVPIATTIVDDEDVLLDLDPDEDALVCTGERIALVDIVEDDLILGLPMVARHREGQCPVSLGHYVDSDVDSGAGNEASPSASTYKPFADLKTLTNDPTGVNNGRPTKQG